MSIFEDFRFSLNVIDAIVATIDGCWKTAPVTSPAGPSPTADMSKGLAPRPS